MWVYKYSRKPRYIKLIILRIVIVITQLRNNKNVLIYQISDFADVNAFLLFVRESGHTR